MQSVLSRNWTRIAVSISCGDNHYTTGTSNVIEPSFPYYLPVAGGIIVGFIHSPRVLVCEKQIVSSRIWTRVAVSISNDDNHYTTVASRNYLFSRTEIAYNRASYTPLGENNILAGWIKTYGAHGLGEFTSLHLEISL